MGKPTNPSTQATRARVMNGLLAQGEALRPPVEGEAFRRARLLRGEFLKRAGGDRKTNNQALFDLISRDRVVEELDGYYLRFTARLGHVLALSLGTESVRGALVDANGELSHRFASASAGAQLVDLSPTLLLNRLARLAHAVLHSALESSHDGEINLIGVAVAWPTPLSVSKVPSRRVLRHDAWGEPPEPVTELVAKRLRLADWAGAEGEVSRSHAINDANAAAASAAFTLTRGWAVDTEDRSRGALLALRIGGGIGAGVILLGHYAEARLAFLDSHLLEGRGYAGEIAHLPIRPADVEEIGVAAVGLAPLSPLPGCGCGREICLDTVASARAIVDRVRRARVLEEELQELGDADALRVILEHGEHETIAHALHQAGQFIGRALAAPVMLLNPRTVVLTGAVAHPALVEGIEARKPEWRHVHAEREPDFLVRDRDEDRFLPVHGAGLLVMRRKVFRRFDKPAEAFAASLPYREEHLAKVGNTLTRRVEDLPVAQP